MTKKRNLTTFMIAIMIMLFSLPANAQGTVGYVEWNGVNTLTFKGGESVPDDAFALNTVGVAPKWSGNSSCTNVVFDESFKDAKPTSCYHWFEGFEQLKVIEGIEYLNTEKVTNMSDMFAGCKDLTSLDLSSFNTAEVTNMSNMFVGCSGLLSLGVSSFNTANVTDMSGMFVDCSNLTSLDLSSFNTAKVTNMSYMFGGCSGLTTIYVSDDFATGTGTNGSDMFYNCTSLKGAVSYNSGKTGIDMANFDGYFTPKIITPYVKWDASTNELTFKVANNKEEGVYDLNEGAKDPGWSIDDVKNNCTNVVFTPSFNHARPTSCCSWFSGFSNLTTIEGIENLNTEEVKNMSYMFYNCRELTSLNLSSFYTANVTNMSYMFSDCPILTSLTLSSFFNTANVTDMSYMFCNCEGLTSLTLSSFNTDKVENMSYMFYNCQSLESLILSSFNTANVTNMSNMFNNCQKLTSLDLSNFDTSNVTNMFQMFYGCSGLTSLNLSNFDTANVTDMGDMFYECSGLTSLDVSKFNTAKVTNMNGMFNSCSGLTSLNLSNFNTANVTNMGWMFNGCSGLTSLNLSSFNTAKVTNMSYMFNGCSGLTSLNLSSFNTAKVEKMNSMFKGCSSLTSLDLSSFNTAEVENMSGMFAGCKDLTSLDLSSFNTAKVTNMSDMFNSCSGLTTIYVSDGFTTDHNPSGSYMFDNCTSLNGKASYSKDNTGIEMAKLDGYFTKSNLTPYVKWNADTKVLTFKVANNKENGSGVYDLNQGADAPGWLENNNCEKVVFTSSFKQVWPTSCYSWFESFSNLTTIQGIENLNTEKVTDMRFMFYGCSALTSLDLSSFKTAEVEEMSYMFGNCTGLKSLYLSLFNTVKVTHMDGMFGNCSGLISLDLSSFTTDEVTNMSNMFVGCSDLTSLDLSSFNTANVENMSYMFNSCSGLTSLDLSSFNTAEVTDMTWMFYNCQSLTTIYVSDDFKTGNVTFGSDMFYNCTSLEGAVSYDSGKTDKDMANFGGYFTPKNITPYVKWDAKTKVLTFKVANKKEAGSGVYVLNEGDNAPEWVGAVYSDCEKVVFTPSFKQAKPTSCCQWFLGFSQLTTIEGIENLNTEKVTDMSEMFNSCSGLTSLDLSSFNTAKVTNMNGMFGGCDDLISLDLSSFNTAEVTDMTWMFYNCQSLTTIYVSDDFTKGNVRSSDKMFQSCFGLEGATSYYPLYTGIEMANYKDGYFKTYFTLGENKVELCGDPLTTKSLDLSGDYDFTPKYEFKANEATYSRDLSSSGSTWFSLCLPFAYTPANFNFTAYQLNGATANAVEIEEITGEIVAGTPVLFKFKDAAVKEINLSATGANIVKAPVGGATVTGPDGSSLQLCGTYQNKSFSEEDGNAFILLKDKLMNPAKMYENTNVSKVSVNPFRAYMTLTASAQTSSARAFSIGHGGEGNEGTTAIDLLNSVATDDAEYYDINGRRIDAPAKGVNIVRRGNKTIKLIIK